MKRLWFILAVCLMVFTASCAAPAGSGSVSSVQPPVQEPAEPVLPPAAESSVNDPLPPAGESSADTISPPPDENPPADELPPADTTPPAEAPSDVPAGDPLPDAGEPGSADSTSDSSPDIPPSDSSSAKPDSDPPAEDLPQAPPVEEPAPPEPPVFQPTAPNGIPAVCIVTAADVTITRDEYVDCKIGIVDPTGTYETIIDENSTIKVRGHSSSQGKKKPYNFKFSSKQELLGLGNGKKWALLANMYDKTQLRNLLAFNLASDIGMPYVQQSTFVEVYLNGEYRGIYQLCEPVDVDKTKVDIDKNANEALLEIEPRAGYSNDSWIRSPHYRLLLGFNEPEVPSDAQRAYFKEFLGAAETAMGSGDYAEVCKYVDVASFANAYIVQELFKQVDYTTTSTRFYIKEGKLYEGPVWDFDLSSGNCSESRYPEYHNKETTGLSWQGIHCVGLWNQYLFQYDEFKQLVSDRLTQLQPIIINLYEDNELGRGRIDDWLDKYREAIDRNNTLWSTRKKANAFEHTPVDGTYDGEIDFLRDWLKNRNQWLLDYYCAG